MILSIIYLYNYFFEHHSCNTRKNFGMTRESYNYIFQKAFRFRCPGQQLVLRALYAGDQRHVTSPDQRDLHKKLTAFVRWRNLSFLGQIKRRNCNCDFLIWSRTHEIQVPVSHQKWTYLQMKNVWPNQEQLLKQIACGGQMLHLLLMVFVCRVNFNKADWLRP